MSIPISWELLAITPQRPSFNATLQVFFGPARAADEPKQGEELPAVPLFSDQRFRLWLCSV